MLFNTLLLSFTTSLDAMGIGITYGLRRTSFSNISKFIFFLVSLISTTLSICLGNVLKAILSPGFTTFLGATLIVGIGIHVIRDSFKTPTEFDFDGSNDINIKEALCLSISVTADSLCVGIGASMLGINNYIFPILVATLHLAFLLIGDMLGKNLVSICKIPNKFWSIISGILLIIIGFCKFI